MPFLILVKELKNLVLTMLLLWNVLLCLFGCFLDSYVIKI